VEVASSSSPFLKQQHIHASTRTTAYHQHNGINALTFPRPPCCVVCWCGVLLTTLPSLLSQGAVDKVLGYGLFVTSTLLLLYYSIWVLVLVCVVKPPRPFNTTENANAIRVMPQPFLPADSCVHGYFLARSYAFTIPFVLLLIGLIGVFGVVRMMLNKSAKPKQN
jgi:hypothetical protein